MATPNKKPAGAATRGRPDRPIYARTSVLCNGQIVWKVRGEQDLTFSATDPQKADLKSPTDAMDDLNALNGLQFKRSGALEPLELKQPLRHVQSSLPKVVKPTIYTGDLYGSMGDVFSCPSEAFETRRKNVFGNEIRANGNMNYNDFFRRLRRSEWLLWDVQPEKGHWVLVIAHLSKSRINNPNKKNFSDNANIPATITSPDFNVVDDWCIVSPERGIQGETLVERVESRLEAVLKEGRIKIETMERPGSIWIPTTKIPWASGLHVFNIIKTLMHRITEFYCHEAEYDESFWDPLPGWVNLDEIRAEMQGRAAQRCMAATGYRSRIAIEGVRRYIGWKEIVRANELRPRHRDNVAFRPGLFGKDGYGIPVSTSSFAPGNKSDDEDDEGDKDNGIFDIIDTDDDLFGDNILDDDEINIAGGPVGPPPKHVYGWDPEEDTESDVPQPRSYPLSKIAKLKELGIELDFGSPSKSKKKKPGPLKAAPTPITPTKAPPKKVTAKKPSPVKVTPTKIMPARITPAAPVKPTQYTPAPLPRLLSTVGPVSPTPTRGTWAETTTPKTPATAAALPGRKTLAGDKKRKLGLATLDRDIEEAGGLAALVKKRLAERGVQTPGI